MKTSHKNIANDNFKKLKGHQRRINYFTSRRINDFKQLEKKYLALGLQENFQGHHICNNFLCDCQLQKVPIHANTDSRFDQQKKLYM